MFLIKRTVNLKISYLIIISFLFFSNNFLLAKSHEGNDSLTSKPSSTLEFTSSNLPIIVINTHGQQIINESKITADLGIIYKGEGVRNYLTDSSNNYNGIIGIEIRGSSSQMFPKKQYAVETRDQFGEDSSVSLLGFPEESDWVLYAPYSDKTLLRNVIIYKLYNEMGRYATRTKFCELVLNDEYMGVYVLMEKIKRNKNRVDIKKLTSSDTTGNNLTGGYIIKIDKMDGEDNGGWQSTFTTPDKSWQRTFYQYHYPKPEDISSQQKNYIHNIIYQFEREMIFLKSKGNDTSYTKLIDVNSLVDYFIINEVAKNVDGYRLSLFFYKDRDDINNKLVFGPIWDYNIALGNADYDKGWTIDGWELPLLINDEQYNIYFVPFWWEKLNNNPYFMQKVYDRWEVLKDSIFNVQRINNYVDSMLTYLDESQKRNFQKWNILNSKIWPNYYVLGSYSNEITFLKAWIKNRIDWINQNISDLLITSINKYEDKPSSFLLKQNYPNPFNPITKIQYEIPVEGKVSIKVYDILGREIKTLLDNYLKPGKYEIEWNADNFVSGIYFYQLKANSFIQTKKMILLK